MHRLLLAASSAIALTLAAAVPTPADAMSHGKEDGTPAEKSGQSADHGAELSAEDQAMLDGLSPDVRQQVIDRLGPEQTVTGILETMIINAVAERYPGAEDYVPDIKNKNVKVVFKDEQLLVNIDPATMQVTDSEKM